jgi:hypothetical protein
MKIRPFGAELFHSDGQTDRHNEANSLFSQFCEPAQKWIQEKQAIRMGGGLNWFRIMSDCLMQYYRLLLSQASHNEPHCITAAIRADGTALHLACMT